MAASGDGSGRRVGDLLAVLAGVVLVLAVVFSPASRWRPAAIVIGVVFAVLAPGYALVSAVFPRRGETAPGEERHVSWVARIGLSVGGSVVAVAAVGSALDFTVWGFQRSAVVVGLCLFTVGMTAVAWFRRGRLPAQHRAGTTIGGMWRRSRSVVGGGNLGGVVLSVLVVLAVAGVVGVVAEKSTTEGSVTEFYILGEDESGDLSGESYPSTVTVGEPVTVALGVGTAGSDSFEGTVVGRLERVSVDGDAVEVAESRRLDQFSIDVESGDTTLQRRTIRPPVSGERLRLTYRLYPSESQTPTRQVHVWLSVTPQQ